VAQGIGLMRDHPGRKHSLDALARACGLSPSRFRHAFRETTGVSVKRYRLWNRLGKAVGLATTGETLTEAALAAGFSSSAHFSAAFRDMFGSSPSDFLRSTRGTS